MPHAVVIGGSMAGLLCARVLSDHFDRVTILDRDTFPAGAENRRGVPQGRHAHGLLASGGQVLERFFPGISSELVACGAIPGDPVRDARWFIDGGCLDRSPSGLKGLLMSRPLLESVVRQRVLALPNVDARENVVVSGLSSNPDQSRVTGVRIGDESLDADLVADCSGRASHTPRWLESLGYSQPVEEKVEIAVAYTTRTFRRDPRQLDGDVAAIVPATPEGKRGGVLLAQEGDRWTLTLIGYFGQVAPTELDGFIEYARTLPTSCIHDAIRQAEPLGEPASARYPASTRRRYERLQRFPEGFLVFGDAICSFNPIYGQGMSVSAMEAVQLADVLARKSSKGLANQFFQQAAKVIDIPWDITVGSDLRMKETVGPRTPAVKFINWYMSKLHRAAHRDPVASLAFHRVSNLLAPPPTVMHPRVAARVLLGNLRG